jgi:hypothetical protein
MTDVIANNRRPKHLDGWPAFDLLDNWRKSGPTEQKRWWVVSNHVNLPFRCNLTWRFGDGQLGSIDKFALSGEEAVYLALNEFMRWEEKASAPVPIVKEP